MNSDMGGEIWHYMYVPSCRWISSTFFQVVSASAFSYSEVIDIFLDQLRGGMLRNRNSAFENKYKVLQP